MKLVIDIPEEVKKTFDNASKADIYETPYYDFNSVIGRAIQNGIPLPKGHGRLIDADKIVAEATECMKYPANYKYMECVIAHMKLAPSIIEADKAESDEQEKVDDYRDRLDELEREEYYESKYGKEQE